VPKPKHTDSIYLQVLFLAFNMLLHAQHNKIILQYCQQSVITFSYGVPRACLSRICLLRLSLLLYVAPHSSHLNWKLLCTDKRCLFSFDGPDKHLPHWWHTTYLIRKQQHHCTQQTTTAPSNYRTMCKRPWLLQTQYQLHNNNNFLSLEQNKLLFSLCYDGLKQS